MIAGNNWLKTTIGATALLCAMPAAAIMNGHDAQTDAPTMVLIVDASESLPVTERACGGVLVSEQWVLTHSSCVMDVDHSGPVSSDGSVPYSTRALHVLVGNEPLSEHETRRLGVTHIAPHPGVTVAQSLPIGPELALLRISEPVYAIPTTMASGDTPPANNSPVEFFGWGVTQSGKTPGAITTYANVLQAGSGNAIQYVGQPGKEFDYFFSIRLDKAVPCDGDRGGPVIGIDNQTGQPAIVGILTNSDHSCQQYSNQSTQAIWIAPHAEWIDAVVSGNLAPDPFLEGELAVGCDTVACDFDATDLTIDGKEPIDVTTVIAKEGTPAHSASTQRSSTGTFGVESDGVYQVTSVLRSENVIPAKTGVEVNMEDQTIRRLNSVVGDVVIRCDGLLCTLSAINVKGVAYGKWTTLNQSFPFPYLQIRYPAAGTYTLSYSGVDRSGQSFALKRGIVVNATPGANASYMHLHEGSLRPGESAFPYSVNGIQLKEGHRLTLRLHSNRNDLRVVLQRSVGRNRWQTLSDAYMPRSTSTSWSSYTVRSRGRYRLAVRSGSATGSWRLWDLK